MTVCPWCKARVASSTNTCPKCGQKPADHPSVTGRTVGDAFGDDDDIIEAPALDLDISTTRARPGNTSPSSGHEVGDAFGDEDDAFADPGPGLDLDLSAPTGAPPPPTPASDASSQPKELLPRAITPNPDAIEVDPIEVKLLASYGAEPRGILETVPYALRVLKRQRELKRSLEGVRAAVKEAEVKRDERLVELGSLLRPVLAESPEFEGIAKSLGEAEKVVKERESALMQTNAAFREKAAATDAEIAALAPERQQADAERSERQKVFDEAELLRKKHEARRKRVEIDVRAAQAKLAAVETPAQDRAQAQALIAAADQERETRAAEERIAQQAAQKAESELATAKSMLGRVDEKIEALREKRRVLEREYGRAGAAGSEGVAAASKEMRAVLLEIGRKTWKEGPDAPGADLRRKGVADAMASLRRLQVDLEKHVRALAAADKPAVAKGLALLSGALVLFLTLFVVWRATRTNPYLEEQNQPKSAPPVASQPAG
jgi:hypothetical protein